MTKIRKRARHATGRMPASTIRKGRGRVSRGQAEYTIQQTSELLGIPIQKLRRWDEQGVLIALRTNGGHRRYSKDLIDRLAVSLLNSGAEKSSRELATIKRSLAEKRRIIQLLVERVDVDVDCISIRLRTEGMTSLVAELQQRPEHRRAA